MSDFLRILEEAQQLYKSGKNITETLRETKNLEDNNAKIIELAYELQAGTYISYAKENQEAYRSYCSQLSKVIDQHIKTGDFMFDVGTGELTTLTEVLQTLNIKPKQTLASDISWSRLKLGRDYANEKLDSDLARSIKVFSSEMSQLPILDKSIDLTISSHALEPNRAKLREILSELSRVTSRIMILFEPSYENNTEEGKAIMDKHGYIRGMKEAIRDTGASLIDYFPIPSLNLLNPTWCHVIKPAGTSPKKGFNLPSLFSVPGTNRPLIMGRESLYSTELSISFPILQEIPILRLDKAILTLRGMQQ